MIGLSHCFSRFCLIAVGLLTWGACIARADDPWIIYEGGNGPGKGKHIVLISGDEEYRSEEALPQLARILSSRHGFKCTVLFAVNPADGTIDPSVTSNIPGLESLAAADMMVIATRFRALPDQQMRHIDGFVDSGKPIVGLRTATHAFAYPKGAAGPYVKYDWRSTEWPGGFGRQVLGETWVSHHGNHGVESTRGVINPAFKDHPILRGVENIWGPTDVYTVTHLNADSRVLVHGQVLEGMKPTDRPVSGPKNDPLMPLAWTRSFTGSRGRTSRVFCTTMGAAVDLQNEGLRRLLVNACYWGLGLEDRIAPRSDVDIVGTYNPLNFGFGKHRTGLKPSDIK
jgi:type 1 glutamine amidotransferase